MDDIVEVKRYWLTGVVAAIDPSVIISIDPDFEISKPSWVIPISLGILCFFRFWTVNSKWLTFFLLSK